MQHQRRATAHAAGDVLMHASTAPQVAAAASCRVPCSQAYACLAARQHKQTLSLGYPGCPSGPSPASSYSAVLTALLIQHPSRHRPMLSVTLGCRLATKLRSWLLVTVKIFLETVIILVYNGRPLCPKPVPSEP